MSKLDGTCFVWIYYRDNFLEGINLYIYLQLGMRVSL